MRQAIMNRRLLGLALIPISLAGAAVGSAPAHARGDADLQLAYHATFGNGSLESGVDPLAIGALKEGASDVPNSDPQHLYEAGAATLAVTRPPELSSGLVGSSLYATPVSFGQGSIFRISGTFYAPVGPHDPGSVFAVVVAAKTGSEVERGSDLRAGATLQVRGSGARLNVPGASPPVNLPNVPQAIYDAIFDPKNPTAFTLELLVDRIAGRGEATLKVRDYKFSQSVQFALFKADSGPPITAVGTALAIASGPDERASVKVTDFELFVPRTELPGGLANPCPADFGCVEWP